MPALDPSAFLAQVSGDAIPLDLRAPVAFAVAHVPGAVFLQFGRQDLAERAELYLSKKAVYALVTEPAVLGAVAEKLLTGAGYRVVGHLAGGMAAWSDGGRALASLPAVAVAEFQHRLGAGDDLHVLDVREDFEYNWGHIPGTRLIPHGEIWLRAAELDRSHHWHVICNDQVRSCAAASILSRLGFSQVTLVLGGIAAWTEAGFSLERAGAARR